MSSEKYTIREAKDSEKGQVFELIQKFHTPEDVVMQGFMRQHENEITPEVEAYNAESLREIVNKQPCIVAVEAHTNKIVGAIILMPRDFSKSSVVNYQQGVGISKIIQKLYSTMLKIRHDSKFSEHFSNVDNCVLLRNLVTDKEHRGRGLAKAVLNESVRWAKKNGYDMIYGGFAAVGSRIAAENCGFVKIVHCDLHEVKDSDGSRLFADVSPNNILSFMAITFEK